MVPMLNDGIGNNNGSDAHAVPAHLQVNFIHLGAPMPYDGWYTNICNQATILIYETCCGRPKPLNFTQFGFGGQKLAA